MLGMVPFPLCQHQSHPDCQQQRHPLASPHLRRSPRFGHHSARRTA
jgi:hypothetical protein